ncbi:MAG: hypothetical protein OEV30_08440 [Ignavibacteria bacterium]|nr:hypothetical protein [Ignavibacteria bacterium]
MKAWILAALLVGVIPATALGGDPDDEIRHMLTRNIIGLGHRAQVLEGTISMAIMSLPMLVWTPHNAYGSFVLSSPSASSVTLTATGLTPGWWSHPLFPDLPMEIEVIVYSDSMTVWTNN